MLYILGIKCYGHIDQLLDILFKKLLKQMNNQSAISKSYIKNDSSFFCGARFT